MVDYGFSKRLDETLEKWGKDRALRDVVGAIRTERPFVVIARFQGNARDGHGNHSAAGLVTREAFELAADPKAFPEQIAAGLRPWQPLKLYMGGVRESEDWTLRVDSGEYDPVLGDSYQSFARRGLSFQRSQNGGRFSPQPGPSVSYYKRLDSVVDSPGKETTFFDGIDTTLPGVYRALRRTAPEGAGSLLTAIEQEIQAAVDAFKFDDPSAAVPALARALAGTRGAAEAPGVDPDVKFVLGLKEQQIADAIQAALGISLTAIAQPAGSPEATGPFNAGPPAMPPVVPGQAFEVRTVFANRGRMSIGNVAVRIESTGHPQWTVREAAGAKPVGAQTTSSNGPIARTFTITVPENAALTRPYFSRASIQDTRYTIADESQRYRPAVQHALEAAVRYEVSGVPVEIKRPVTRLEPNLPYGYDTRVLAVVPAIAVTLTPANAVTPLAAASKRLALQVEVLNNREGKSEGTLALKIPDGWKVDAGIGAVHLLARRRAGALHLRRQNAVARRIVTIASKP